MDARTDGQAVVIRDYRTQTLKNLSYRVFPKYGPQEKKKQFNPGDNRKVRQPVCQSLCKYNLGTY